MSDGSSDTIAYYSSEDEKKHHSRPTKKSKHTHKKRSGKKQKMRRTISNPFGILVPKSSSATRKQRRISKKGRFDIASPEEHIMVIDSACDQSMVHQHACKVLSYTSEFFNIEGAMEGMASTDPLQVVNAAVKITNPYTKDSIIGIVNQSLLITDKDHHEALLQPNQARQFGTAIDDCAKHHLGVDGRPGQQCIQVPDLNIPLLHDGWKAYLSISKPTDEDMTTLPVVEFTSPQKYNPLKRVCTRRVSKYSSDEIDLWRKCLGYAPKNVIKKTLENTSQLVKTVECEQRTLMRDHRVTRLAPLRPHCVNDVCYSDTFFSSIASIRGYTMFQLFCLEESKVDHLYLMKQKSQAPDKFADYVRQVGAPNYMINDHAKELTGSEWLKVARRSIIDTSVTEPYHQNSNLAERRGGSLKENLQLLFLNTPWAPFRYW